MQTPERPSLVTMMRHGVAVDRADPRSPPDFERPLTVEGRNRTEAAVRGLRTLGVKPERVLASPFLRCQQTARLVIQGLGLPRRALVTTDLLAPAVDPRAIWGELASLGATLLVGHGGTLEPIAGVALGLPTVIPGEQAPPVDLAYRTLGLRKAGALQLEVRFRAAREASQGGLPRDDEGPVGDLERLPAAADPFCPRPVSEARLAWKLSARMLRLIGR